AHPPADDARVHLSQGRRLSPRSCRPGTAAPHRGSPQTPRACPHSLWEPPETAAHGPQRDAALEPEEPQVSTQRTVPPLHFSAPAPPVRKPPEWTAASGSPVTGRAGTGPLRLNAA